MIEFYLLNPIGRSIILLLFLALLLANFAVLAVALTRPRRYRTLVRVLLLILLCYFVLVVLTTALHELSIGVSPHSITGFFVKLPVAVYLLFLVLGGAISLFMIYYERQYWRGTITKAVIKESVDNLPAGLCFGTKTGIVLIANRCMDSLCHVLTGHDLQDVVTFWKTLIEGELRSGAIRLEAFTPIIRLTDGRTWSFTRRIVKVGENPVIQIIATNITDLNALRVRLQEDNKELAKMNARLRRYSKDIIKVKAKEERLAAKVRIHGELGYALLATRYLLEQNRQEGEAGEMLDLWRRNIAILRGAAETVEPTALDFLAQSATAIGIRLCPTGSLPEDIHISNLILRAAGECMTNAVRHARATELYLKLSETDDAYTAVFSDNGTIPVEAVIEGGGLSGLRHKVEDAGGVMDITRRPRFTVTITTPKERSE